MEPVNILDARNNLSQLVTAASHGDEVVIAKRGTPVVRLVAITAEEKSAGAAARWLTTHLAPARGATGAELDARIERERSGWE